ncbi:MAG: BrnT family toxin [Acidibrevibacterium sp.]|uniref:BrnT family toxin n=1 Tax=Acidibrevibacterium sp. TaxID=2606776 RepID=UPI003D052818
MRARGTPREAREALEAPRVRSSVPGAKPARRVTRWLRPASQRAPCRAPGPPYLTVIPCLSHKALCATNFAKKTALHALQRYNIDNEWFLEFDHVTLSADHVTLSNVIGAPQRVRNPSPGPFAVTGYTGRGRAPDARNPCANGLYKPTEFEWNAAKSEKCRRERGFPFADVLPAFADPGRRVEPDHRFDYGEPRFQLFGHVAGRLFVAVYTPRTGR